MKKLSVMTSLWLCWLLAALLCVFLLHQLWQSQDRRLPLPQPIHRLDIIRADTTLSFQANPDWQSGGKAAVKLGNWLDELRQSCPIVYDEADIALPEEKAPITLRFNGEDDWTFTAYNPFNHSHYLHHQGRVYLCHEQLKPRLSLPLSYWLEPSS